MDSLGEMFTGGGPGFSCTFLGALSPVVLRAVATVLAMAKEQTVMINKSGRWKEGGERDQREGEPIKGTLFRRGACRVVAR
jgi:hypothetical protein